MESTLKALPLYISDMKNFFLDDSNFVFDEIESVSERINLINKSSVSKEDKRNIKVFNKLLKKISKIKNSKIINPHKERTTKELLKLKSYLEVDRTKFKEELIDIENELIIREMFPSTKTKETIRIEKLLNK